MVECQGEETTAAEATEVAVWAVVGVVGEEGEVAEERSMLHELGRPQGQEPRTTSDIIYLTEATETTQSHIMSFTGGENERNMSQAYFQSREAGEISPRRFKC